LVGACEAEEWENEQIAAVRFSQHKIREPKSRREEVTRQAKKNTPRLESDAQE